METSDLQDKLIHDLIGQPFRYGGRGPDMYDCYGLCIEIYRRLGGKKLPDYHSTDDIWLIHQQVLQGKEIFSQIAKPEPYCFVLFELKPPYATHIGIMLDDVRFIHIQMKKFVCIERIDSFLWKSRVKGFYKWTN